MLKQSRQSVLHNWFKPHFYSTLKVKTLVKYYNYQAQIMPDILSILNPSRPLKRPRQAQTTRIYLV